MSSKGIVIAIVAFAVIALGIVLAYNWYPQTYSSPANYAPSGFQQPATPPSTNGPTSPPPPGY